MNNFFSPLLVILINITAIIFMVLYFNKKQEINTFSSYYNTEGAFAGFIQKKNKLFRACEFSTNGAILSCSKWFDDDLLKQGQNEGINEENI